MAHLVVNGNNARDWSGMEIRLQSCSSLEDVKKSLELAASLGKTGEMEAAAPQSLSPG